ncbi:membrane protein [Kwoniella mangroviensis CBS 8886]|nr:membrane protein [Kwoniella mangroviensis CBS 8886]
MTTETGAIIYKAFAPTIKMMICIGLGIVLTKKCNFQPVNAKGVSILSLNISLPLLIFGSMVSAFTPENIKAFGPLFMVAVVYQLIGLLFALITRELFYVPKDFHHGILVLGMLSNWGNLPTAVVQTLAKSSPFDPDTDVELGVAYIAVFVLVMTVTLFPLGMHKMCAWDFREDNLLGPPPLPIKERWAQRFSSVKSIFRPSKIKEDDEEQGEKRQDSEMTLSSPENAPASASDEVARPSHGASKASKRTSSNDVFDDQEEYGDTVAPDLVYRARFAGGADMSRKKSRASSFHSLMESTRPIPPTAPLEASGIAEPCQDPISPNPNQLNPVCSHHGGESYNYHHLATPSPSIHAPKKPFKQRMWKYLEPFLTPFMAAIVLGIICSTVRPIKALLVPVDGWSVSRIPNAPNDEPPLSFIMDTATFLGGISIPGGLVLLGASFGRLKLPKKWSDIPFAAILLTFRASIVVILPLIGVFFIEGLRDHTDLYPKEDKMRTFVAILLSGTPSSVNQMVITQLYNPNGTADTLSTFLLLQYIMMPVLSTALAAIALFVVK